MVYIVRSILIITHFVHACPAQEYHSDNFEVIYNVNFAYISIRHSRKKGQKHIFSFGGKKAGHSESALRGWADDVLRQLDAGETFKLVKEWVLAVSSPEM